VALQAPEHFLIDEATADVQIVRAMTRALVKLPAGAYTSGSTRETSGERRREERTMTAQPAVSLGLYALEDLLMQHCGPDDGSRTCPQVRKDRADHRTGDRTEL
jgi:hypothetical protein